MRVSMATQSIAPRVVVDVLWWGGSLAIPRQSTAGIQPARKSIHEASHHSHGGDRVHRARRHDVRLGSNGRPGLRAARQCAIPELVQPCGSGEIRPRSRHAALVLVLRGRTDLRRGRGGRQLLRDRGVGIRLDPDGEPAPGSRRLAQGRAARAGRDRQGPHDGREDPARARLPRSGGRLLRGLRQPSRARAPALSRQGLRGARGEIPEPRRGADLLRAVPCRNATAVRPDLCRVARGGGDPGETVHQASEPSGRRPLSDPQLRRAADRRAGRARRAALREDRARRAARAAHALAHLHPRRRLGRFGGDQPPLGHGRAEGQGARRGAARDGLHDLRLPPARPRRRRAQDLRRGALGAARSGDPAAARKAAEQIAALRDELKAAKSDYWASEVEVMRLASLAWVALAQKKSDEALGLMRQAADMEDKSEKNIVTPGRLVPARELLGDMLLELNRPADALKEYDASQAREPNRYRGLYGAGMAASQSGNMARAKQYFGRLVDMAGPASSRAESGNARAYLARN